jgi:hypothetical protein
MLLSKRRWRMRTMKYALLISWLPSSKTISAFPKDLRTTNDTRRLTRLFRNLGRRTGMLIEVSSYTKKTGIQECSD